MCLVLYGYFIGLMYIQGIAIMFLSILFLVFLGLEIANEGAKHGRK
jgi:hypothetical protein